MISLEDCIAMCGLSADEVAAIAEHEHVPEVIATTLGSYLLHQVHGSDKIRQMLMEDIRASLAAGNTRHAALLTAVLRHFLALHSEGAAGGH